MLRAFLYKRGGALIQNCHFLQRQSCFSEESEGKGQTISKAPSLLDRRVRIIIMLSFSFKCFAALLSFDYEVRGLTGSCRRNVEPKLTISPGCFEIRELSVKVSPGFLTT